MCFPFLVFFLSIIVQPQDMNGRAGLLPEIITRLMPIFPSDYHTGGINGILLILICLS